jgi:LmbE family N-acetylglucosaminyl deacetylase
VESLESRRELNLEPLRSDIGWRMIHLNLDRRGSGGLQILCLGSHADDIEIGCGGTILYLAKQYPGCVFHWVVFSAIGVREAEAQHAASLFIGTTALRGPLLKAFPDGFMPFVGAEVKAVFEELKQAISPDVIFTHSRDDRHQDHRVLSDLTWNTFRDHLILEYEIPKYDGDLGRPNVFVPLESGLCEAKIKRLLDCFASQRSKHWFDQSTFQALMRLRGMECCSKSGYAEAFYEKALVYIGARVTNIIVHEGGTPRFVRILLMGGADVTDALSERTSLRSPSTSVRSAAISARGSLSRSSWLTTVFATSRSS